MQKTRNVGILLFDDVEVMDFCGPFEVFSVTNEMNPNNPFNVFTVAEKEGPVYARNNLSINPKYTIYKGISAGIDMSLYVIEKLLGKEAVLKTVDVMEYGWM